MSQKIMNEEFFPRYVLFVFLLPFFFVLHGFSENFDLVPLKPALRLTFWYILVSAAFLLVYRLVFKSVVKAGLMTFFTMSYHFFLKYAGPAKQIFSPKLCGKIQFYTSCESDYLSFCFLYFEKEQKTIYKGNFIP